MPKVLWSGKVFRDTFRVVCTEFKEASPKLVVSKLGADDMGDPKWDRVHGTIEEQVIATALWFNSAHLILEGRDA